ncbi:pimeloyl-ACP methyl ester carboxylesterase [Pseudarthrobacter oxydans]|uniref:alpha/beta fold hydrolase n=1 Tax=Pseudarthrobacter oxydans TaxID=1671 RepID=UPI0027868CD1|nr:alpha/beta hydrolase [Pseudarthrobacter oxydans]MDP9983344.1 pimeloyl-ACP methyl ester carboxylesterase [Pseudarthrobacter oxydans]
MDAHMDSTRSFVVDVGPEDRIHCIDTGGDGLPVVILHGLAGSSREFFATAGALPEFRTVLVDLRGHGQSTRTPSDLSREAFVADVVQVIETAVGGPVALVGQSMGGHTAMLVAAARPDLVSKLVLLESNAGGGTSAEYEVLGDFFRSWPVPFPDREAARAHLGDDPLPRAWVADLEERADGLWPRFDADVMVKTMNNVVVPRWAEWEGVNAPALVVYGEKGMFSAEEKSAFVVRGRNVQRVDLAGASHDGHLDAFDEWAAVLRAFLAGIQSCP